MEWLLIFGCTVVVMFYYALSAGGDSGAASGTKKVKRSGSVRLSKYDKHVDWLEAQWVKSKSGEISTKPWFFDEVSERQLDKLAGLGVVLRAEKVNKGQASDIIGLYSQVDEADKPVLKFFKVSQKGMNQTSGRYKVREIMGAEDKSDLWKARSATPMQKEFYRFFELKVPKGLKCLDAEQFIDDYLSDLCDADSESEKRAEEWGDYEALYDDFTDPDFLELYEIKKVSLVLFRQAVSELNSLGVSISGLESDLVVKKLLEMKPDLQRRA